MAEGERKYEKKGKKRAELVGDCSRGWSGDKKGWFLKYLSHPHNKHTHVSSAINRQGIKLLKKKEGKNRKKKKA